MTELARLHVACRRLDAPGEYRQGADEVVPIASMYKVLLALEVADAFERGALRPDALVELDPERRSPGGFGLTMFRSPAAIALQDLVAIALAWSDNTAADALLEIVGLDALHERAARLGLRSVQVVGSCALLLRNAGEDFGYASDAEAETADWEPLTDASELVLERTTRGSPDDLVELAALIDRGEAAHPEACARVRALMAQQVWGFRFAEAFPPPWQRSTKTGTLSPWRGEFGIVGLPDGPRFALAVVARQHSAATPSAIADRVVADAGRAAVTESVNISNEKDFTFR